MLANLFYEFDFNENDLSKLQNAKKSIFLNGLKSTNTGKYKRYQKSPLRYPGGKSLAVGIIIEHFPNDIKRLISPFMGGGSVEIATALELEIPVLGFDIFDILINFWNVAISNNDELIKALQKLEPSKDIYKDIKIELSKHFKQEEKLDPITLARDYFFNFNLSYGPGFLGWMSSIYECEKKYQSSLNKLKKIKNINLQVSCSSFEKVIPEFNDDFLYLDPPYFLDGDSKMFKGIYPQRNFPIHHNGFNHELLSKLLKAHKGGFVLSYNDCDWVRNAYKEYEILEPSWQYTMGQGETRIGKNRLCRDEISNIKKSHELLIIKEK